MTSKFVIRRVLRHQLVEVVEMENGRTVEIPFGPVQTQYAALKLAKAIVQQRKQNEVEELRVAAIAAT